ncbi:MAG: NAD-dependent protein deacetylase [Paracidovorax wautersii]|uniref:protein acetyllysine N-acetyltransferase n=1 Tax=Paracidovorax wautersii TaxID=1177982 RepID=A0A7V8FRC7_9BURK|nr:MAG: NAD-dependent protein deacetylase [Paracidovorax wautersii]
MTDAAALFSTDRRPAAASDWPALFARHTRWMVLTGAGVSTDSGIPDYRDREGGWKRPAPIQFGPFMRDPLVRARYWARSLLGWRFFGQAGPNAAHQALAQLEQAGRIGLLLTQNVDGLHQAAGSQRVLELHGGLARVRCMGCGALSLRADLQPELQRRNPGWARLTATMAPDGDADLEGRDFSTFDVPPCPVCDGILKPDVVFYGESVPAERHVAAQAALAACDGLLVLGSSLMVQSSYRYAVAAHATGKPVVAVNLGRTRADDLLSFKLETPVAAALAAVLPAASAAA